jgi:predicted ABC-type ATPase
MPILYIITGSNGAGKSSIGPDYIPLLLRNSIFDGDKLFMNKRKEFYANGIRPHKECRKMAAEVVENTFDELVNTSLHNRTDFAYEGHFTNDATWDIPKKFKEAGYEINLIFFGLTDTALSEMRVIGRTHEGGHYVEPPLIEANFYGNLKKLDIYFPIFDSVEIYDTSTTEHIELVKIKNGSIDCSVSSEELPLWFRNNLTAITANIETS